MIIGGLFFESVIFANAALDALVISAIISAVVGVGASIGNWLFGKKSSDEANDTNLQATRETNALKEKHFQEQLDYTKATQQETWRREDTSYQRTVADLQAAGLSPLAMNGTNDAGAVVNQPAAPDLQAGSVVPFLQGIYPQISSAEIQNAIVAQKKIEQEDKRLDLELNKHLTKTDFENRELEFRRESFAAELEQRNKQFLDQLTQQASQHSELLSEKQQQRLQDLGVANRQLAELVRSNDNKTKQALQEFFLEQVKTATGGRSANYEVYTDKAEYQQALQRYYDRLSDFIEVNAGLLAKTSQSQSTSANANTSANLGMIPGQNLGATSGVGKSQSTSSSYDGQKEYDERFRAFCARNPFPVYNWSR